MIPEGPQPDEDYTELSNEFASVKVRKVATRNGERLEIWAPRQGFRIFLCPLELESLTWQTPEVFSNFLTTPFGPEPEFDDEGTGTTQAAGEERCQAKDERKR